jgi:hypothetical protein
MPLSRWTSLLILFLLSIHTYIIQAPQPKWAVLQVLNFVVIIVFVGSISYVASNYTTLLPESHTGASTSPLTNFMFPMMVLWSLCLAYFFGFFGISFIDKGVLSESPSTFGLQGLGAPAGGSESEEEEEESEEREVCITIIVTVILHKHTNNDYI